MSFATGTAPFSQNKVYADSPATQQNPVNSVQNAHCTADQNPVLITTGANKGKFYCTKKAGPSPATQQNPADSVNDAHCTDQQNAVEITSGSNKGKFYCTDSSYKKSPANQDTAPTSQQGVATVANNASGCQGDGSQCGSTCGSGNDAYTPAIDIGCRGQGNPIADALFGIIRILSDGVGLVVVASIIVGGIQYSASRGDPQSTAMAINRIRSSLFALLIYIFAYAFLNFLLPNFVL
jgi:hypothetical protein